MPRRVLIAATVLVVALHAWLLQGMPLAVITPAPANSTAVFMTRSLPAPVNEVAAAAAPAPAQASSPSATPPSQKVPPPQSDKTPRTTQPRRHRSSGTSAAPVSPAAPAAALEEPASKILAATPQALPADADAATEPVSESVAAVQATQEHENTSPTPSSETAALPATHADLSDQSAQETAQATAPKAPSSPTSPPLPVQIPPPMRLSFEVSGQAKTFSYSARAQLVWQHDGHRYEARQEITAFLIGKREQRSVGTLTAQGLQPERFSDRSRSEQATHFDHDKGRIIFSANAPEAALEAGMQDRLSVFIQLGALLAAAPQRYGPGTQITLPTASTRSAEPWTFSVEAPETLNLPVGAMPALKLQRLPRRDYDQKAELWLAPALHYLPVRIRLTQTNGDFADLRLTGSSTP